MKKSGNKSSLGIGFPKGTKKYVPSLEETTIILNYFMHNNFQDFNTWQQISRSKCQFQYIESKNNKFQCKVALKWEDTSLPIIGGSGTSRDKKNAKKKALTKLVQNLIYLGFISYGFKESDFIKKLPRRRKQTSEDEEQQNEIQPNDLFAYSYIKGQENDKFLSFITEKNFEKLMYEAIKQRDLQFYIKILRKIQKQQASGSIDTSLNIQDLEQQRWQNYCEMQLRDPFQEDLADILKYYQLQLSHQILHPNKQQASYYKMELPCSQLAKHEGKISFQFFQPIQYSFIFHRDLQIMGKKQQSDEINRYMNSFLKQIEIPKFDSQGTAQPLSNRVITRILNIILQFSFDYKLVVNLLSIFQRQVNQCNLQADIILQHNATYFLRNMLMITAEFAYLLSKKIQVAAFAIQGLINIQPDGYLSFIPKQPEQFVNQKISKKINTNQLYQMSEFANEESILLVSKIDPNIKFIGQIAECWPAIKIKCMSLRFQNERQKQKLPFTMYKLANAKLYNRFAKSISHIAKSNMQQIYENTFIIEQRPTQTLLLILCQILSEWLALNETVLIVSDNFNQIYAYLNEKGFRIAKITEKADQKSLFKRSIICCSPLGICADAIKNYAFTRVLIEGAHRVSQTMSSLALDKGCQKLYLFGDSNLPQGTVISKFASNRKMNSSIYTKCYKQKSNKKIYNFPQKLQHHFFEKSILRVLNKFFYNGKLNKQFSFQSPSIKGFPWPSQAQRVCFIHVPTDIIQGTHVQKMIELCCQIICSVIKSGFITANQIGCRVTQIKTKVALTSTLFSTLKKFQIGVKPELSQQIVDFVTGSRFKQKSLCILLSQPQLLNLKHINAALQEGKRGSIIISSLQKLAHLTEWQQILRWAKQQKIMLKTK